MGTVQRRKWFFGALLLMQVVDIADTYLKGYDWGPRPAVLITYGVTLSVAIIGIISERRSIQLVVPVGAQKSGALL